MRTHRPTHGDLSVMAPEEVLRLVAEALPMPKTGKTLLCDGCGGVLKPTEGNWGVCDYCSGEVHGHFLEPAPSPGDDGHKRSAPAPPPAGPPEEPPDWDAPPPGMFGATVSVPKKVEVPIRVEDGTETNRATGSRDAVSSARKLVFRTAKEVAEMTPAEVPWVARPWVAVGAITELDGKIKAAGKTTFLLHMCGAVLKGVPFLGEPTAKTHVVYLTEQNGPSFREALARAGLLERDDLHILHWHETVGVPWPEVVAAAVEECHRVGAKMLVVDTLSQFAGLRGDAENNAGDALKAIEPLQAAAASGLAVVLARHERKSGGEVGDSARGSSAFGGAVDVILSLRRPDGGNASPNVRVLHALSRFSETPSTLTIELTEDGYVSLGSEGAVAVRRAREAILDVAPAAPEDAMTLEELRKAAECGRHVALGATNALLAEGILVRIGAGKRGDPYRYHLAEFVSVPYRVEDGTEMNRGPGMRTNADNSSGNSPFVRTGDEVWAPDPAGRLLCQRDALAARIAGKN